MNEWLAFICNLLSLSLTCGLIWYYSRQVQLEKKSKELFETLEEYDYVETIDEQIGEVKKVNKEYAYAIIKVHEECLYIKNYQIKWVIKKQERAMENETR